MSEIVKQLTTLAAGKKPKPYRSSTKKKHKSPKKSAVSLIAFSIPPAKACGISIIPPPISFRTATVVLSSPW